MKNFLNLISQHPTSVGESYLQHMATSFTVGGTMALAAMAALIHGVFPFFVRTDSNAVIRLHERMVTNRNQLRSRSS